LLMRVEAMKQPHSIFLSQTPLWIDFSSHWTQGWVVKATAPVAAHTILCEYSGQVDYTRHHVFDTNDDIMDLIRSPHSSTRSEIWKIIFLFHWFFCAEDRLLGSVCVSF
jgi:hypothetical protein